MVIASQLEGGAHVVSKAIACETPVVASDIPGNRGLLGDDHSGYFEVGDETDLVSQLQKAGRDKSFLQYLHNQIRARSHLTDPVREHDCWERLIKGN